MLPEDERIAKFVVSVSLRALWSLQDAGDATRADGLARLEPEWRGYLLDRPGVAKGPHSHHILFADQALLSAGPPNLRLNHARTTAYYVYELRGNAYLTCHMAGMQTMSMLSPPDLPVSRGTQVYPCQTLGRERHGLGWGVYIQNLRDFSDDCDAMRATMTDAQREMSVAAMEAHPDRVAASEDYRILEEEGLLPRVGRPTRSSDS